MPPKGILDGFTRVDDLLIENTDAINRLADILQLKSDVTKKPVFLTYPSSGSSLVTIEEGTTTLNFEMGTITDINGDVTDMKQSLQKRGFEWARSFFIQSDKLLSVQIDDNDPIITTEERDASGINQQFKRIKLTASEDTDIFVIVSTSPDALIQLISNSMVLADPKDAYSNRNYIGGGELAARLGSIRTFEKRGETVFLDGFEDSTLKWLSTTTGSGGSVVKSIANPKQGNYSMKLTTGDAAEDYALLYKYFAKPFHNRVGLEISFTVQDETKYFWMKFSLYTGAVLYEGSLRYDNQNDKLQYLDSAGNYIDLVTSLPTAIFNEAFCTLKYSFDYTLEKYITAWFNHSETDMSAIALKSSASAAAPRLDIFIYHSTNTNSNELIYVDNFIYTQNEP